MLLARARPYDTGCGDMRQSPFVNLKGCYMRSWCSESLPLKIEGRFKRAISDLRQAALIPPLRPPQSPLPYLQSPLPDSALAVLSHLPLLLPRLHFQRLLQS